jgi:phosphoglycerol transferase MdoB-like AlkP superfamily enzyme
MTFNYEDGIAILQLIVYVPCLFLAVQLTFRHGLRRSSSWYFIAFFTLIRIVGACCLLVTISWPRNMGLHTAAIICGAIGLSPLILACVGLLSRAYVFSMLLGTLRRRIFS